MIAVKAGAPPDWEYTDAGTRLGGASSTPSSDILATEEDCPPPSRTRVTISNVVHTLQTECDSRLFGPAAHDSIHGD